jgi:hypothetical protein
LRQAALSIENKDAVTTAADECLAMVRQATTRMLQQQRAIETELMSLLCPPWRTGLQAPGTPAGEEGMRTKPLRRWVPAEGVAGLMVVSLAAISPAAARADAGLRLAHAVPGAGAAKLEVVRSGKAEPVGTAKFGEIGAYREFAAGTVTLQLVPPGGGKPLATKSLRLTDGRRYTVVGLLAGGVVALHAYTDGNARPGVARLRVIHAVPELGSPNLVFDGQTVVRHFPYHAATPYLSVKPGVHRYAAKKPGDGTLLKGKVDLEAAKAYTGLVVGSRGERVRVVAAVDDEVAAARKTRSSKSSTKRARSTYVVRSGDSLWAIAKRGLGPGAGNAAIWARVVKIWNKNEIRIGTGDPDLIYPGTNLRLP